MIHRRRLIVIQRVPSSLIRTSNLLRGFGFYKSRDTRRGTIKGRRNENCVSPSPRGRVGFTRCRNISRSPNRMGCCYVRFLALSRARGRSLLFKISTRFRDNRTSLLPLFSPFFLFSYSLSFFYLFIRLFCLLFFFFLVAMKFTQHEGNRISRCWFRIRRGTRSCHAIIEFSYK